MKKSKKINSDNFRSHTDCRSPFNWNRIYEGRSVWIRLL